MTVPQITARSSPAIKKQFEGYAASFGLDASELAKLLIARERRHRRLAARGDLPGTSRKSPGSPNEGKARPTITAHLSSVKDVEKFDTYAEKCGLSRGRAAAILLEDELRERWLEKAISAP